MTHRPVLRPWRGVSPQIAEGVFLAETAAVIGDVEIGAGSSVWYGCTLRGDVNSIRIGRNSNIQDGTVIHVSSAGIGTVIGDDVTVGHLALLHACTVEDLAFVGMKAVVMDGAVVESGAMVAAGALVTPGKRVRRGELWAGSPARKLRDLTAEDVEGFRISAQRYAALAAEYRTQP